MPNSNTLLIAGCGGFIGSAVAARAVELGFQVTGLSLNLPSPEKSIHTVSYLEADITDKQSLIRAIDDQNFDYVINCSGYIDHASYANGGDQVIQMHYNGLINLIGCTNHSGLKRLVQLGSSDEYGEVQPPQIEDSRENPISPYSFAKVAASHMIQMLFRTEAFPGTVARLFLVYGPGQNMQRFIPQIIEGCLQGRKFSVSAGDQIRDFCYIEDIANGIIELLNAPKTKGEVLNLSSGIGISIHEVITKIQCFINNGTPDFGKIPYRPGENMSLYANIEKVSKLTNWRPVTELDAGLETTIEWYRKRISH